MVISATCENGKGSRSLERPSAEWSTKLFNRREWRAEHVLPKRLQSPRCVPRSRTFSDTEYLTRVTVGRPSLDATSDEQARLIVIRTSGARVSPDDSTTEKTWLIENTTLENVSSHGDLTENINTTHFLVRVSKSRVPSIDILPSDWFRRFQISFRWQFKIVKI